MTGPMTACSEAKIEALLAGTLEEAARKGVEDHLDACAACRERIDALAATPDQWSEVRSRLASADDPESSESEAAKQWSDPRAVLRLLAPTDDPEMLGRLGPYEIQGIIGSGGMGVVLKGWDRSLHRFVAIKLMAPHLAASAPARRRFLRESRAAAAVVHENVVAIHGVAEADGLPYLVMPYSRGESLQKRLDRVGPLAVEEILRISLQTARGLAAAHAQGLVHRDVKPANILLDEGVERVLLMDFGLARAVDDASLTRSGVIAGTPQYMSPEQVLAKPLDPRADLFALGSTMYAMSTGHAPFRAESTYAILRQITDVEPQQIDDANPEIPEWLCRIVAKLMAKNPEERFESARELAELLEACLANLERSPEMPLSESAFGGYGIFTVLLDDLDDDADEWPEKFLDGLAGAYAGRIRELVLSRGGIAVGILTLLTMTVVGFVIGTEPPDVAGIWHGEDWGVVKLEAKAPGTLEGTFDDTVNGQPGKLKLQWSRVERRFVGDWHEGEDRFGKVSIRLDGDAIRGAMTTDPASKVNPGTPQLADLAWFRHSFSVGRSFGMAAGADTALAQGASAGFGLARDPLRFVKKDLVPFQGKWVVVEERISGLGRKSPALMHRPQLKSVVFRDISLLLEYEKDGETQVIDCPKIGDDFEVVIMNELPDGVFEGQLLILKELPHSGIPQEVEFRVDKDDLELKFGAITERPVRFEYRLHRGESPLARAMPGGSDAVTIATNSSLEDVLTTRSRARREVRPRNRAISRDPVAAASEKAGDDNSSVFEIAPVEGVAVVQGQRVAVDTVNIPAVRALPGQRTPQESAADITAEVREVPAPAIAETVTVVELPNQFPGQVELTRPSIRTDVLGLNYPKQFPEDYAVVRTDEIRHEKPSLTLKASWSEGDTETIRTITVQLSETSSTALIRLKPIRSISWSDGKSNGTIGDPKSGGEFSLIQFELLSENVVRVKCWAEKPRKPQDRTGSAAGQPTLGRTVNGTLRYRIEADAKAVDGKPVEAVKSSNAEAKAVTGKPDAVLEEKPADSKAITTTPGGK